MPGTFGGSRSLSRSNGPSTSGSSHDGTAPPNNPVTRARNELMNRSNSVDDSKSTKKDGKSTSSPSPTGLFSMVGLAQPTLEVTLAENILFLHPAAPDQISDDPVVQGTVILFLPKKRNLTHLSVKLIGRQDIAWGEHANHYESNNTLDKELSLLGTGKDMMMEKGHHRFEFSFHIPSQTPCTERSIYGRVRYWVVAKAKGLGQLNGDVSSVEKQLFFVVNPGGAGDSRPPPPLDHRHEGIVDGIGPYTMALQSQHIMVGGLLLLRFHLISPPADLVIYGIKVKLNQYFTLVSPTDPKKTSNPPVDTKTVIHLDGLRVPNFGKVEEAVLMSYAAARDDPAAQARGSTPLKVLKPEEEYKIHHLARLPNDSVLRPSTPVWNNANIRVRHEIALEMTYRLLTPEEVASGQLNLKTKDKDDKGKERIKDRKKLVVTKPFEIFSCVCFVDSLSLPAYTLVDPNLSPGTWAAPTSKLINAMIHGLPNGGDEDDNIVPPCVCGMKFRQVIRYHGQDLLREPGEEGVTYAPIAKDELSPVTSPAAIESRGRAGNRNPFFRTGSNDRLSPGATTPPARTTSSSSLSRGVFDLSLNGR